MDQYALNSKMIKAVLGILTIPFTLMFNKFINEGICPNSLKIIIQQLLSQSYLKVFEIIFKDKSILTPVQFIFRQKQSTIKAVAALIERIVEDLDTLTQQCVNCVNIQLLLKKIDYYGLRENSFKLLESVVLLDLSQLFCWLQQALLKSKFILFQRVKKIPYYILPYVCRMASFCGCGIIYWYI